MGVIPNPKMAFIFPISCILALIFPNLIKYFPKCVGKGSFPKSQIKSLLYEISEYPPGLYSKHVPIVPVLVESWSGQVNSGPW